MIRSRSCSFCHAANNIGPGSQNYCRRCGHRADCTRLECNCPTCRPCLIPPGTDSHVTDVLAGATKTRMPFGFTRRDLALSMFYNVALETVGNGTLSEAEAQAHLMLGAEGLLIACHRAQSLLREILGLLPGAHRIHANNVLETLSNAVHKALLTEL